MKTPSNIYLIGPMGAGKSTVGRQLAKFLNREFVDCDREIEARTGVTISLIFELEGEAGFRKREKELLAELVQADGIVMATGGGVVLGETNRSLLVSRGFTIYLRAPIDLLVQRTHKDRNRPLIQTDDPDAAMRSLMEEREPLYQQVADLVIKTSYRSAKYVVKEITRRLAAL